jgi:two-component system, LuxR family, response regulator FixJ
VALDYSVPVVLVSAYVDVPVTVRAIRNGAVTVLEKPCRAADLADAIRAAVGESCKRQAARRRLVDLRARYNTLDDRERQVAAMIVDGLPNKAITHRFGVCQRTVDRLRSHVFEKMRAQSAVELTRMLIELSIGPDTDGPLVKSPVPCWRNAASWQR